MYNKGDFHIHSNNSDGKLSVNKLLDLYKENGYDVISITDHDTMQGCKAALEYGKEIGLKVIAGIEISTKHLGESIHMLGYFSDNDWNSEEMAEFSKNKQNRRITRCKIIVSSLEENFGIKISADDLINQNKGMIGRPHIAKEIIRVGYAKTMEEVFEKYLGNNSPTYIPSSIFGIQDGIDLLRRNHATVVLAHPVLINNSSIDDLLSNYRFDGIEAIYGLNTKDETKNFIDICSKHNLLITGGSDFHDFNIHGHSNIGDIYLDSDNISKLINHIYR